MKAAKRKPPASSAAPFSLRPWHVAAGAAVALLGSILAYQPALNGPFVFDDQYLPFYSPSFAERPIRAATSGVRPLLMITFWLNQKLSGLEPASYHFFNLLFHFMAGLLVFYIVRWLLARAGEQGGRREGLSAFAAGLFLLHPVQTEAVSYVASRSENLSVLFFYAAFALFLYRRREAISWTASLGVLVLFGAAASTKEHTVVLPALLLLTDYFWNPGFSFSGVRRNWRLHALLAGAAAAGLWSVWRLIRHAPTAGFRVEGLRWYEYFYTQCLVVWEYFRLFLLPFGQNADYDHAISRTLLDHGAIAGLIALAALVGCAIRFRRRFPLGSYGLLVTLLLLAPTSSFVPIRDAMAERRLYLPMIGLLALALELLRRWKARPGVMAGVLGAVLLAAGVLTYQRNTVWASEVALWEDVTAKSPYNARAQFQLGMAYYAEGRCQEAAARYAATAQLKKPDHRLLVDWALADDCLGRSDAALEKLERAAALDRTAHVYSLIGMIHGKAGRTAASLEAIETALRLNPRYDMAWFYRGNLRAAANDLQAAAEDYRRALQLNPRNRSAQEALARVEANPRGRR